MNGFVGGSHPFLAHISAEEPKNYSKTKPMRFAEFQTEIDWWGNEADGFASRQETEHAWKVSIAEIRERHYNLDIKNPFQAEEAIHDPDELLARYEQQQAEIQALRDELKAILGDALAPQDKPEQARRSA